MAISVSQYQTTQQLQTLSQHQIQTLNFLKMGSKELREEILKAVQENPALEITFDPLETNKSNISSDEYQNYLEQASDNTKTLQQHLIDQINLENLSQDEHDLCLSLVYNLDKNGCYGSMLDPITLLDANRPNQTPKMLQKCLDFLHRLDPIGCCCKTLEESLYVQALINEDATPLTLFLLDNHLDLMVPPHPERVLKNIKRFLDDYHAQSFTKPLSIDNIELTCEDVEHSINYIRRLNPHPASSFSYDESFSRFNQPDVVLTVETKKGFIASDSFENGMIKGDDQTWFLVKYASGILPEIKLNDDFSKTKENRHFYNAGKDFIQSITYRKNTIALQGVAIVSCQREFFLKGKGHIVPLTRKQIAKQCNIAESTVSRMTNKKNSKYIQCKWGVFPAHYFFSSSLNAQSGQKISSETIKVELQKILQDAKNAHLSDSQLAALLQEKGITIARRTISKYRNQIHIQNSYQR